MKRRVKLVALVLTPAVFLASLAGLASNKVNARLDDAAAVGITQPGSRSPDPGTSNAYRSGRLLLPVALAQAEEGGQSRLSKESELRLLKELQSQLGEYRPWAKVGKISPLREIGVRFP